MENSSNQPNASRPERVIRIQMRTLVWCAILAGIIAYPIMSNTFGQSGVLTYLATTTPAAAIFILFRKGESLGWRLLALASIALVVFLWLGLK